MGLEFGTVHVAGCRAKEPPAAGASQGSLCEVTLPACSKAAVWVALMTILLGLGWNYF